MMYRAGYAPGQTVGQTVGAGIGRVGRWAGETTLNALGSARIMPWGSVGKISPTVNDVFDFFTRATGEIPERLAAQQAARAEARTKVSQQVVDTGRITRSGLGGLWEGLKRGDTFGDIVNLKAVQQKGWRGLFEREERAATPKEVEGANRGLLVDAQTMLRGTLPGQYKEISRGEKELTQTLEELDKARLIDLAIKEMKAGGKSRQTVVKAWREARKVMEGNEAPEDKNKKLKEIGKDLPEALRQTGEQARIYSNTDMMRDVEEGLVKTDESRTEHLKELVERRDKLGKDLKERYATQKWTKQHGEIGEGKAQEKDVSDLSMKEAVKALEDLEDTQERLKKDFIEAEAKRTEDPVAFAEAKRVYLAFLGKKYKMTSEELKANRELAKKDPEAAAKELQEKMEKSPPGQLAARVEGFRVDQNILSRRASRLQRDQFIGDLSQYQHTGLISQEELDEIKEATEGAHPAQAVTIGTQELIKITGERRRAIQEAQLEAQRGLGTGIGGIEAGIAHRKGMVGPEAGLMTDERSLVRDQAMNVWNIKKQMMDQELQFTVQYAHARANIIKVHYDNLNQLEKTRLEQMDRRYAPHIQYGQGVFGAQQTMVGAQMGRYQGEDYWRAQFRGARGLREGRTNLMLDAGGFQMPRELQIMRAMRNQREAEQDFKRQQARQMEHDRLSIGAGDQTMQAIQKTGVPMAEFMKSEGGRNLVMQILQQNQGAYSRQGIDVSGQIIGLAGQQQAFAGRKLVAEMGIRGREGRSIESQISGMYKDVQGSNLDVEGRQKAQVEIAEKHAEAAKFYASIGDVQKAAEHGQKQEALLAQVPDIMKRDFGDTQKKSLEQLKVHTQLLTEIARQLGSGKPAPGKPTPGGVGGTGGENYGAGGGSALMSGKDFARGKPYLSGTGGVVPGGGVAGFGGYGFNVMGPSGPTPSGPSGAANAARKQLAMEVAAMKANMGIGPVGKFLNNFGGKMGDAWNRVAPFDPNTEVERRTPVTPDPEKARYSEERGIYQEPDEIKYPYYMEDVVKEDAKKTRQEQVEWAKGVVAQDPEGYQKYKENLKGRADYEEKDKERSAYAEKMGFLEQTHTYGQSWGKGGRKAKSYYDPQTGMEYGEDELSAGMAAIKSGTGITGSPDSQRDNQENKPEDKMGTASDKFSQAVDKFSQGATIKVQSDGTGSGTMGSGSAPY
jgi:hypothetical protein